MGDVFNYSCSVSWSWARCGYWESGILGLMLLVGAAVCFVMLFYVWRMVDGKAVQRMIEPSWAFWLVALLYCVWRGVTMIAYFPWVKLQSSGGISETMFFALNVVPRMLLMFIVMCLLAHVLFQTLFMHHAPPVASQRFLSSLIALFAVIFFLIAVVLCVGRDADDVSDPDRVISMWTACTSLGLLVFLVLPAWALRGIFDGVGAPGEEERACVRFSTIGIYLVIFLFSFRCLWNASHFFGINVVQNRMYSAELASDGRVVGWVRLINVVVLFLWEVVPVFLAGATVMFILRYRQPVDDALVGTGYATLPGN